jgi:hypothetical protein
MAVTTIDPSDWSNPQCSWPCICAENTIISTETILLARLLVLTNVL